MGEVEFAKTFLAALNSNPTKIPADHVEDPKTYPPHGSVLPTPPQGPSITASNIKQYILPKNALPLPKRQKLAPGAERSLSVTLRSLRNPPLDITLPSLAGSTSILDLKQAVHERTSIPVDKLRVLHKKKPVPDSRVLKEVAGEDEKKLELGVMVIGGTAAVRGGEEEVIPPVVSGGEELGEEFWKDLKGFLVQRVKNEDVGEKAFGVFKKAWDARK
jgi:ubiquitin-like protein 4